MAGDTDVTMLWESVDASSALASRFGFATVEDAASWLRRTLSTLWAGRVDRCDRLVISAGNLLAWLTVDGRPIIAKCCADPARFVQMTEVDALVAWLGAEGLPVAAPIVTVDGRVRIESDHLSIAAYPVVDGDLLDITDPGQVQAAGHALARLHLALSSYPGSVGRGSASPGAQLVHGDYRSANILHDGVRITAVLDFDDVAGRTRVADLAQAAVLLATRYHDWEPTSGATRDAFVDAYRSIVPLSGAEWDDLHRRIETVMSRFGWS